MDIQHVKKADRLASAAVKKSRRRFEYKLAQKIKDDKKSFFAYARSKTKSRVQVGPLPDETVVGEKLMMQEPWLKFSTNSFHQSLQLKMMLISQHLRTFLHEQRPIG